MIKTDSDFAYKAVVRFIGNARNWFALRGHVQSGHESVPTYFDPNIRAEVVCPARDAAVSVFVNARGRRLPPEELAGVLEDLGNQLVALAGELVAEKATESPRKQCADADRDPLAGLLAEPSLEKKNAV